MAGVIPPDLERAADFVRADLLDATSFFVTALFWEAAVAEAFLLERDFLATTDLFTAAVWLRWTRCSFAAERFLATAFFLAVGLFFAARFFLAAIFFLATGRFLAVTFFLATAFLATVVSFAMAAERDRDDFTLVAVFFVAGLDFLAPAAFFLATAAVDTLDVAFLAAFLDADFLATLAIWNGHFVFVVW